MISKLVKQWQRVIDAFTNHSLKVAKAESEMEKSVIKDEPAGFDCEVCGSPMVIKLGRFGKFYACSNFPDCRHTAIVKEIGVECPSCHQDKSSNVKPSAIVSSMVAIVTQNVSLLPGTNQLAVTVQNADTSLVEKKVRGGGKQVVCSNGDYEEEKLNKMQSPENEFQALFVDA